MNLIGNLSDTMQLCADERNYILVIKKDKDQAKRNGYYLYFQSLESVFQYLFEYQIKYNLANNIDKDIKDAIKIMNDTRDYIKNIISPFELLQPKVK